MKLTLKLPLILSLLTISTICQAQVSFGKSSKFNDNWLFTLTDDSLYRTPEASEKNWQRRKLPHDWSIEGHLSPTLASCTGYLPAGIGWYRKHFKLTKEELSNDCPRKYIYFEGVYNLNGQLLGKRPNGYASFLYEMTPYLKEGDNVIAVRVDHSRNADSRWYTGSGIYRDVWMVEAPVCHLAQWGTGYKASRLTNASATVDVDVEVENIAAAQGKVTILTEMLDAAGKVVAKGNAALTPSKSKVSIRLNVSKPHRWNLNDPYLYNIRTSLLCNGKVIDSNEMKAGLRTLDFNADKGFSLNGKNMKVKGVCLHHDAGVLGAVVPEQVWERRLIKLKEILRYTEQICKYTVFDRLFNDLLFLSDCFVLCHFITSFCSI